MPADRAHRPLPDEIEVPPHWQFAGTLTPEGGTRGHLSRPHDTNRACPWPRDPPCVPDANPTGVYARTFTLPGDWGGLRLVLRFDGVDGCFTVAVNGEEVGMSKGSRLMAGFDLNPHLRGGEDTLAVRVIRFGDHRDPEDQDVRWLSGTFRGVTLLAEPEDGLGDLRVQTGHADGVGTLRVRSEAAAPFSVTLLDADRNEVAPADPATDADEPLRFSGIDPRTAETPNLHTLVVEAATGPRQVVAVRLGFRTVDVAPGGVLRLNGTPIKLRGVNRHGWSRTRGRSVTAEEEVGDARPMKRHNVDRVRTSHDPPHPRFPGLCDELGLLVIDGCDLRATG